MYLGFLPGEISNIEGSLHPMRVDPKLVLQAILTEWFQWAPGDIRGSDDFATLQSLKNALIKAGLGAAAHDLNIESNKAKTTSATGSQRQPSRVSPSNHPQTQAMPQPQNQASSADGRKCQGI